MKTAFDDYEDKKKAVDDMVADFKDIDSGFPAYTSNSNKLSNALEATAHYLSQIEPHTVKALEEIEEAYNLSQDAKQNVLDCKASLYNPSAN